MIWLRWLSLVPAYVAALFFLGWIIFMLRGESMAPAELNWFGMTGYFITEAMVAACCAWVAVYVAPSGKRVVGWSIVAVWVGAAILATWLLIAVPGAETGWKDVVVFGALAFGSGLVACSSRSASA